MNDLNNFLNTCPDHIKKGFINIKFNTLDKIILQNESSNFVYIITKGSAKVYSLTPNGVKYLEYIYREYELFGELEVFLDKPTLAFVEALEPCDVIKISKELFLKWIAYDRNFSLYINIQTSQKMYNSCINTKANIVYTLKYRLLFFLWRFSQEHDLYSIHKDIIVEGIGSNVRSVNRVIKELCDDKIVEYNNGFVKIKDSKQLLEIIDTYL